jgi:uncharacterized protein with HEPN domain
LSERELCYMQPESRLYLFDIMVASDALLRFITGKTRREYLRDELTRAAVERQFGIIGEALSQLSRRDSDTVERITNFRDIIDFRNRLAHAYREIDHNLVWDFAQSDLLLLRTEVSNLLEA